MEGTTGVSAITTAAGSVLDLAGTILTTITENEILCFMFAASFVSIGVAVFARLKRVCK